MKKAVCLLSILMINAVHAEQPLPSIDSRIRHVLYNQNEINTIALKPGFATRIELEKGAKINVTVIGKKSGIVLDITGSNTFYLKTNTTIKDTTNLLLETSKGMYYMDIIGADEHHIAPYSVMFHKLDDSQNPIQQNVTLRQDSAITQLSNTTKSQITHFVIHAERNSKIRALNARNDGNMIRIKFGTDSSGKIQIPKFYFVDPITYKEIACEKGQIAKLGNYLYVKKTPQFKGRIKMRYQGYATDITQVNNSLMKNK